MMGNKDELIMAVRSVLGQEFSDMDVIRALHMAKDDVTAAINIILDTPSFSSRETNHVRKTYKRRRSTESDTPNDFKSCSRSETDGIRNADQICSLISNPTKEFDPPDRRIESKNRSLGPIISDLSKESEPVDATPGNSRRIELPNRSLGPIISDQLKESELVYATPGNSRRIESANRSSGSINSDRWLVGSCEITGLSTCKGRRLKIGEPVKFSFPSKNGSPSPNVGKFHGRGRSIAVCSDIVRFSTEDSGEIGRIPTEWARCLLPLVNAGKVRIDGYCKAAPDCLSIMDSIDLSVSVYINSSMFRKHHQTSLRRGQSSSEDAVIHPLPTLFRMLGLTPFKKAEFTPEDLYTRKQSLEPKDSAKVHVPLLPLEKRHKLSSDVNKVENEEEDPISDSDLDKLVGTTNSSELEEMDPPSSLRCELRTYQKQALYWMSQLEKGRRLEEAATMLHPCWDAYRLADKRELVVYLNAFSGDATTEFPSVLQMAKGGILADAMGLGKTIMTIALMLSHSDKGGSGAYLDSQVLGSTDENTGVDGLSSNTSKKITSISAFSKLTKSLKVSLIGGGNLIVCPMTLLGQWKTEIETHAQPGSLSVYVHYGQSRAKDANLLAQNDVVLTTYGVLSSEFLTENAEENGGLYSVHWFRLVLDEAHIIKSPKSQVSLAASALIADRRWCLTGTPIQNNLEDIYSLLRFLKVEPWSNSGLWHKLIQKPFEEGDERGLKLVQSILKPIMLRRTKSSTDKEGRPIIVLPPADVQVIYCELTEAEKDFYEALFKRSKVKFDQFVEQGRVLHNYASILELLLRLRQCCDHPFLVMSRGDTQEFADLKKLAKRFLKGGGALNGEANAAPSKAYVQEVVEELRKGEKGECPICLEAFEDAVLTPCAHRLCRECLLACWQSATSGLCPICRKSINRQDLITAPTDNRFQVDVDKNWVESSKVSVLIKELESLRLSGSKSIVFSQWTAFLDLLQIPLTRKNLSFVRLDGTLSQQQREKVIKKFTEENDVLVLLMSLKAGGVGINLTAASNAFLLDPWWNPAVEEQAVMRIHRIGQTQRVAIKRFIVKGTVEERMEAVQARKQRMISGALTDQEVRTARLEELKMLFT